MEVFWITAVIFYVVGYQVGKYKANKNIGEIKDDLLATKKNIEENRKILLENQENISKFLSKDQNNYGYKHSPDYYKRQ